MHAGVAPIPASSGKTSRHRLARGGNRQLNAALHRIAVTQIRLNGPGRAYYQRRPAHGDTTMEALRAPQTTPRPGGVHPPQTHPRGRNLLPGRGVT